MGMMGKIARSTGKDGLRMLRKIKDFFLRARCYLERPVFMKTENEDRRKRCTGVPGLGMCKGCRHKDPEGLKEW